MSDWTPYKEREINKLLPCHKRIAVCPAILMRIRYGEPILSIIGAPTNVEQHCYASVFLVERAMWLAIGSPEFLTAAMLATYGFPNPDRSIDHLYQFELKRQYDIDLNETPETRRCELLQAIEYGFDGAIMGQRQQYLHISHGILPDRKSGKSQHHENVKAARDRYADKLARHRKMEREGADPLLTPGQSEVVDLVVKSMKAIADGKEGLSEGVRFNYRITPTRAEARNLGHQIKELSQGETRNPSIAECRA